MTGEITYTSLPTSLSADGLLFFLSHGRFPAQYSMSTPSKANDELLAQGLSVQMLELLSEARKRLRQQQREEWAQRNLQPPLPINNDGPTD